MSGTFSTYLETALINHVFVGQAYPMPLAIFVAVFSQAPGADGSGGVEITDPGYGRFGVGFATAIGTPPASYNTGAVQWAPATQNWDVVACGLYDTPGGAASNYLGGGQLVDPVTGAWAPKSLTPGDVFRIPIGGIAVGFLSPSQPQPTPPFVRQARRAGRPLGMHLTPRVAVVGEVIRPALTPWPGAAPPGTAPAGFTQQPTTIRRLEP